jgi:hypothetical protein
LWPAVGTRMQLVERLSKEFRARNDPPSTLAGRCCGPRRLSAPAPPRRGGKVCSLASESFCRRAGSEQRSGRAPHGRRCGLRWVQTSLEMRETCASPARSSSRSTKRLAPRGPGQAGSKIADSAGTSLQHSIPQKAGRINQKNGSLSFTGRLRFVPSGEGDSSSQTATP